MKDEKYTVEALIAGGVLEVKNPDFCRAVLGEELYTIKAANKKLAAYFSQREAN